MKARSSSTNVWIFTTELRASSIETGQRRGSAGVLWCNGGESRVVAVSAGGLSGHAASQGD